jgi:hypothetical protein
MDVIILKHLLIIRMVKLFYPEIIFKYDPIFFFYFKCLSKDAAKREWEFKIWDLIFREKKFRPYTWHQI